MKGVIFVKTFRKKFSMILAVLLVMTSLLSVLPLSVSAAGKNLISNSTKIDLLRPDKDIKDVSETWTWKAIPPEAAFFFKLIFYRGFYEKKCTRNINI